jgi:Zn-dependent protease
MMGEIVDAATPAARRRGWSAGVVMGVPVTVQPGSLVLFGLVTALLGGRVLPGGVPGAAPMARWVTALVVAALFVGGVLAHELGHALAARRHGAPAEGISLSLLGGVTDLPGRLPDPAAVWRVAAAGPAVTLALGAGFYGVALMADSGGATLVGMGATWLAYTNLWIGALNLLPGAPFDGGHMLLAAVWRWGGDQGRADHLAACAGQGLGLVLLGAAIVQVGASWAAGAWLGLLGGLVLISATVADRRDPELAAPDPGRVDDGPGPTLEAAGTCARPGVDRRR